jgi:hypothetical protein
MFGRVARLAGLWLLGFASPDAGAFCVENAIAGRMAHASVVALQQRPARAYDAAVEFDRQSCCNPRNAECNPDGTGDDGVVFFRARVDPAGRALACGAPANAREPPLLYAPARGFLRFEPNPLFSAGRAPSLVNPPAVVRILDSERRLLTTFPCL